MSIQLLPGITSRPESKLTLERPDLWARALSLATNLTGYTYAPKLTIEACGGGGYYHPTYRDAPPREKTPDEKKQERERILEDDIERLRQEIEWIRDEIKEREEQNEADRERIKDLEEELREKQEELDRSRGQQIASGMIVGPTVLVPEGAAEWLLHEVGHWLAATPAERLMPDYGCVPGLLPEHIGRQRELEAWAFEVMVLEPFGPARSFCPPEHSGGEAWKNALMPEHFRRIERALREERFDVHQWRHLYGQWARWYRPAEA